MCESVLTHTIPGPPPCAGAFVAAAGAVRVAAARLAAAGLGDAEGFGLNKPPNMDLAGDAEGAGLAATSVFAFLRARGFAGDGEAAGEGETAAVLSAPGEAAVVASAFLRERRLPGDGDAAGDSAVDGDAAS